MLTLHSPSGGKDEATVGSNEETVVKRENEDEFPKNVHVRFSLVWSVDFFFFKKPF